MKFGYFIFAVIWISNLSSVVTPSLFFPSLVLWPTIRMQLHKAFLPFHPVHGVLKPRILKWFAIPFSSGLHFVRILHHDLSVLGGPAQHGS